MNRGFQSNEELFKAIRKLQKELIADGNEEAASEIAQGFSCLNGLTDGWTLLMESLEKAKRDYGSTLSDAQEGDLADISSCVRNVVYRE